MKTNFYLRIYDTHAKNIRKKLLKVFFLIFFGQIVTKKIESSSFIQVLEMKYKI